MIPLAKKVKPEEQEKPKGESYTNFFTRLESLTDTARIRVPEEYIDEYGNIFLPPHAMYLIDTTGGIHEPVDTSGNLRTSAYTMGPGGHLYSASGTYTKGATGTTGAITVYAAASDIAYFLYGYVQIGGAKATAGTLICGLTCNAVNTTDLVVCHLKDTGANASEIFYINGLGEAATGVTKVGGTTGALLQNMIPGSDHCTAITGTSVIANTRAKYIVELTDMANTETFAAHLVFLSTTNQSPTTEAQGDGAWA